MPGVVQEALARTCEGGHEEQEAPASFGDLGGVVELLSAAGSWCQQLQVGGCERWSVAWWRACACVRVRALMCMCASGRVRGCAHQHVRVLVHAWPRPCSSGFLSYGYSWSGLWAPAYKSLEHILLCCASPHHNARHFVAPLLTTFHATAAFSLL